ISFWPMVSTRTPSLSFEDYLNYDDGSDRHYELVDGQLILMNPPRLEHFLIVDFLDTAIKAEIRRLSLPWLTFREAGVRTGYAKSRLTDLCVVTREQAQELLGQSAVFQTPPQLVVEVVSPDSIARDYRYKRSEYAAVDIPEYWIVDPLESCLTILLWEEGWYEEVQIRDQQPLSSRIFPDLTLTTDQILAASNL
ncbi:MAG: Uma2 family endonuclease, partial [Leptolyngbyaceae cyanobacterium]